MDAILSLLWLFLPAYVANAAPMVGKNIFGNRFSVPVSRKLFGENKTIRGMLLGIGAATIMATIQWKLQTLSFVDHVVSLSPPLSNDLRNRMVFGFLLGTGAMGGDLVKSFVKRRMSIAPGRPLVFWDGADYMIGAIACVLPLYVAPLWGIIFLLLFSPILNLFANILWYLLGLKKVWY